MHRHPAFPLPFPRTPIRLILVSDLLPGLSGIWAGIDILDPGSNPQSEPPQAGEVPQRRLFAKGLCQVMTPPLQCRDARIFEVSETHRLAIAYDLLLMRVGQLGERLEATKRLPVNLT